MVAASYGRIHKMRDKTAGFGWKVNCAECGDIIVSALILVRGGLHRSTVEAGRAGKAELPGNGWPSVTEF